ncbi:MAG: hypothetical protein KIH01_07125 [Candidatus Freyarchaeota archaeon]|nr:hypothetical protein [Candidatus Jordarchaeia archaeon]
MQPALEGVIATAKKCAPSIHAIFIIDSAGSVSATSDPAPIPISDLSFLSSLMLIAQHIASGFKLGNVNHMFLEGKEKSMILIKATDKNSIVAVIENSMPTPPALVSLRIIVEHLKKLEELTGESQTIP